MILTVDIGNSRVKVAYWDNGHIIKRDAATYSQNSLSRVLQSLLNDYAPSSVLAVCVAGEAIERVLESLVAEKWKLKVGFLRTQKQFEGITNAYEKVETHGADRWAGVIAAHHLYPGSAVCIIGAGTATTIDYLAAGGVHLGGYILPSLQSMYRALIQDTENVIVDFEVETTDALPTSTRDGVNRGLHLMMRSSLLEVINRAGEYFNDDYRVVVTGGMAETLQSYEGLPQMHIEPDLVMQGLYIAMAES